MCRKIQYSAYTTNPIKRSGTKAAQPRRAWSKIRNTRMAEKISPANRVPYCDPCRRVHFRSPDQIKDDPMFGDIRLSARCRKAGAHNAVAGPAQLPEPQSAQIPVPYIGTRFVGIALLASYPTHLAWGTLSVREVAQSICETPHAIIP